MPKCFNICNIYHSKKELKHFGLEMLVVYEILGHFLAITSLHA